MSLIELLTAMALSTFILASVSIAFITNQKNQHLQYAIDEIQANSSQVFYYLKKNIRVAGILACNMLPIVYLKGSDNTIEVFKTNPVSAHVYQHFAKVLVVTSKPNLHANDDIVISDCRHHEMLKVLRIEKLLHFQKLFLDKSLTYPYIGNLEIKRIDTLKFFVRQTNRLDQWHEPIYALYADKNGRLQELVEGVPHLQFRYALYSGNGLIETSAASVNDWNKVLGISIEMQVNSVAGFPLKKILHTYVALHKKFTT